MRISDWSSDVCSSDLQAMLAGPGRVRLGVDVQAHGDARLAVGRAGLVLAPVGHHDGDLVIVGVDVFLHGSGDRKSVVEGKSVSVRVDLGGRRIIKKQKNKVNCWW